MSLPLPHAHPGLTIGDLAKAAGVKIDTDERGRLVVPKEIDLSFDDDNINDDQQAFITAERLASLQAGLVETQACLTNAIDRLDALQADLGSAKFEVVTLSIDTGGVPVVRQFYDRVGIRNLGLYVDPTMLTFTNLGVVLWNIFSGPSKRNAAKLEEHGKAIDSHGQRLSVMEQAQKAMPSRDDVHRMALTMTEMQGDIKAMRVEVEGNMAIMERLEAIVSRHENHLLKG